MEQNTINNGIKLLGETAIPGGSLLLDGQIAPGILHTVAGLAAVSFLGPIGLLVVKANSYATSVTGRSLAGQISAKRSGDDVVST